MRFLLIAVVAAALTGCGYVGDPLPPALNIPQPIHDLRVLQRGDELVLDFTAPSLTTEAVGITSFAGAEVQVGEKTLEAAVPKPGAPGHIELPAREWVGQEVGVRVVLAGPKGRRSQPSNMVVLRITEPLRVPASVKAEPHPEGVRLSWSPSGDANLKYRVTRVPDATATVDKPEFIDKAVELGKEYKYSVVAISPTAESLSSDEVSVVPKDIFPPAAPTNLTAIAGLNTIELAWERSTEADLKNYRVYRNDQLLAADVDAPAFSDKQVQSGQKYLYSITAVDQTGLESARSAPIEITAP
jgi:fibronectin type 3 domain-containing protein